MIDLEKINALFDNASEVQEQEQPSEKLRKIENALKPKFFEAQRTEDILREYQENSLKASQGMKEILQELNMVSACTISFSRLLR